MLRQFNRQLALHGEGPKDSSIVAVIGGYAQFLKTNRRPRTGARYRRVLGRSMTAFWY
jgi:hypothetical protein